MAFPNHVSTAATVSTSGSPKPVNYPASIGAGDCLLCIYFGNGAVDSAADSFTQQKTMGPSTDTYFLQIWAKIAAGTETGTVNFSISEAGLGLFHMARIEAGTWVGDLAEIDYSTGATGASVNPDPDSVTAGGGSADNLFIAVAGFEDEDGVDTYPTNYSQVQTESNDAINTSMGTASRQLAAASDNPGTFDMTSVNADPWAALTIVVPPAGAGSLPHTGKSPTKLLVTHF